MDEVRKGSQKGQSRVEQYQIGFVVLTWWQHEWVRYIYDPQHELYFLSLLQEWTESQIVIITTTTNNNSIMISTYPVAALPHPNARFLPLRTRQFFPVHLSHPTIELAILSVERICEEVDRGVKGSRGSLIHQYRSGLHRTESI